MIDWLVKRLTPYRASVERWASLASITQMVWEAHVDPSLSRLERLRSYYQADYQDLSRLIREMGDYFAEDLPGDTDRPIAVSWRRMELEYKDLELILSSVFRRHYGNLPVTWFPVFAPLHEPYGVGFKVAEGPWPELKNIPPDDMFLTSRGRLGVDHGHLLKTGIDKATFLDKGIPLLRRTKPLHIVYDGPLWYIYFDLPFHADFQFAYRPPEQEVYYELLFTPVGSRFDFIPADKRPLDTSILQCRWESEAQMGIQFIPDRLWHIDWHIPEGLPWLPIDSIVAGAEGEKACPFTLFAGQTESSYAAVFAKGYLHLAGKDTETNFSTALRGDLSFSAERETILAMNFLSDAGTWRLDNAFPIGVPETWRPTDVAITGIEGDTSLFSMLLAENGQYPELRYSASIHMDGNCNACTFDNMRFKATADAVLESNSAFKLSYQNRSRLDGLPCFDEIPADFCPLDSPIGGSVYV